MDSSFITRSDSESEATNIIPDSSADTTSQNLIKNSPYNSPDYKLDEPPNIGIYIFDNGLFTRTLLNIDYNKDREILINCTICTYKKVTTIKGFQSSNYVQHYKNKHSEIAYNKASEKKN
jgi:hypothetical protein